MNQPAPDPQPGPQPVPQPSFPPQGVPVAPTPGSKHEIPAYVPPPKDPRLDWLFKGIGGLALAAVIGLTGWVFGGLHERLDKAEDDIHKIELGIAKDHAETKAQLDSLSEATKKQWEIISTNGRGIAANKAKHP